MKGSIKKTLQSEAWDRFLRQEDETQPIVSVDASNVQVRSTTYFRFVHTSPNKHPYKSIWTSLTIRQTNNIR